MSPYFRAWHVDLKKMLYPPSTLDSMPYARPHTKIIVPYPTIALNSSQPKAYEEAIIPANMIWDGRCYVLGEYQNMIFMMFTGYADDLGKDIWEGDIINQGDNFVSVVQFGNIESYLGFYIEEMGFIEHEGWARTHCFPPPYTSNDLKVLGNFYENGTELMGKMIGE